MQTMARTVGIPTQVRLPQHLAAYVALRSRLDGVSVGETIRRALDAQLDREPEVLSDVGDAVDDDDQEALGMTMPLRSLVSVLRVDQVPELAEALRADDAPEVQSSEDIPF